MKTIKVWDLYVRVFHWSLVSAIIVQMVTAENFKPLHATIGYFIIVLLIIRIIWGIFGSKHARFKDFIYPPADILGYLKDLIKGKPKHYIGHNPAGGAMACFLLFVLLLITLTGLLTYGAEGKGPLAFKLANHVAIALADDDHGQRDDYRKSYNDNEYEQKDPHDHGGAGEKGHFFKEIHETLVGILLFLAGVHICGVIASSYVHKENLVVAMITGYKKSIEPSQKKEYDKL
jgi:cytochrome b